MTEVNPQTGPFFVEGAEPGDTLALHVADLVPARDWGASTTIPFFGALTGTDRTALLQEPLPELTWIYQLDRTAAPSCSRPHRGDLRLELPVAPMLGTVGVAPAGREVRSSLVPDKFGGNMDTPEMRPGTTVYLGVNVEGALFSVGDGHYRQGEGESCGTAVEGAMDVTLIVELIKGGAPEWPRLEHDDDYVVVGSARPLEDAWRASQVGMVGLARGAVRPGPARRLPAAHPDQPQPARERRRRQLQRGDEGAEAVPACRAGLRRHAPPPAGAGRRALTRRAHGRGRARPRSRRCHDGAVCRRGRLGTTRIHEPGRRRRISAAGRGLDDGRRAVGVHHQRGRGRGCGASATASAPRAKAAVASMSAAVRDAPTTVTDATPAGGPPGAGVDDVGAAVGGAGGGDRAGAHRDDRDAAGSDRAGPRCRRARAARRGRRCGR